jgi:6,7-dimethyl-8-ribityllumazine synthase
MAGTGNTIEVPRAPGARLLLVEARYHAAINDLLLEGARAALETAGARHDLVTVPGALEIPTAIALAHVRGGYAAFIALGCVIRGETTHYELVAGESCRGLVELGVRSRALIGNGILTVENEAQALERADPRRQDKGGHAAVAALTLLRLRQRLENVNEA